MRMMRQIRNNRGTPRVTIGQSQRGGTTVNLGYNTGYGSIGVNYSGATGDWEGSVDLIERNFNGVKLGSEVNFGKNGISVSANLDLGMSRLL